MRRLLLMAATAVGGVGGTAGLANADGGHVWQPIPVFEFHQWCWPHSSSVTWPSVAPPGWYTNTYRHPWYLPWYAYYNSSSGPYANWMAGGGYAGYAYHGPAGFYNYNKQPAEPYLGEWYYRDQNKNQDPLSVPGRPAYPAGSASPAPMGSPLDPPKALPEPNEGQVSVTLPADAKLLFNGVAASGTGRVRTFSTPPLKLGQNYQYLLTAEVTRDGRTERVTETVIVRAGETAKVTLAPTGVTTAGAK